jgi:hypothetical protein
MQSPIPAGRLAAERTGDEAAPRSRARAIWDASKHSLAWIAGALLFGWTLAIVWWAVLSPEAREEITNELVIPAGTAESIARGSSAAFVPGEIALRPGSRLFVVNNDTSEHTIGNAIIPPGAVAELTAPADGEGFYCTIHPSGFLGIDITQRPHFLTTVVPALLIGVPLGLMSAAAAWVGRRLDIGDGDEQPPEESPLA